MTLPDCAGGDAARLTIEHNVASVILTSSMDESQRQQMLELGVVDYVIKDNRDSYLYAVRLLTQLLRNKGLPVLVADDSQLSRQVLKQLLQRQLYHVIEAEDGEQALAILREDTSIKLLLCDYAMPKMDGFELVRACVTTEAVMTWPHGYFRRGNNGLSAKFIKYGANDFLTKPFMNEEFIVALQTVEQLHLIEQIKATAGVITSPACLIVAFTEHGRRYLQKINTPSRWRLSTPITSNRSTTSMVIKRNSALRQLAQRLQHLDEHIVARFGGEEFAVLAHCHDSAQLQQQLENVNDSLRDEPIELADSTHTLSVSIGLAAMNHHDFDACLSAADKALYRAKAQGKCQLVCE